MTRSQTSHGGEGPTRGTGPLAGSASSVDHAREREALFGDVRRWEAERRRELDLDHDDGPPKGKRPVLPEEAAAMYRAYLFKEGKSQQQIGREHGWSDKTVSAIVNRKGRFAEMEALDRVEEELDP